MALDQLTSLQGKKNNSRRDSAGRRVPTALLPVGLLLAFLVVFALMFGGRILPALEVQVAPVIALRTSSDEAAPPNLPSTPAIPQSTANQPLLFQSSGWVEPDPYITGVPTLVDGVVKEVLVLEGQTVEKDDLLATLIDDDAKLDVEEAERKITTLDATQVAHCAQLPVLNAEMHALQQRITAERSLFAELEDSARRLASVPKGSVPALDVERARLQVERQQAKIDEANSELAGTLAKINKVDLERLTVDARIKEAQTELNRKKLALDRTQIKSPMNGMILRLHAAPGKKRMRGADDPSSALIAELYDPEKLQARIDVPLTEAAALMIGQPVKLTTDLLPDAKFDGEVTRIVGEADLQRNTLQAKVRIVDPDPRLRPEMLVRAEFFPATKTTSTQPDSSNSRPSPTGRLSLYAPKDALVDFSNNSARAWVVEDNRAQLRDLKVGVQERDGHLRVHDGLRPGDRLILPPHQKLKPGTRIKVTQEIQ